MGFDSKAGKLQREQLREVLAKAERIIAQPDDASIVVADANDIRLIVTKILISG